MSRLNDLYISPEALKELQSWATDLSSKGVDVGQVLPRDIPCWDDYFLTICQAVARRSKDPSTQHGAVVVDSDYSIMGTGFNGPPSGFPDGQLNWGREEDENCCTKHHLVRHAEINALSWAKRRGKVTGCTLYVTGPCCPACMLEIAAEGIIQVVHGQRRAKMIDERAVARTAYIAKMGRIRVREVAGFE